MWICGFVAQTQGTMTNKSHKKFVPLRVVHLAICWAGPSAYRVVIGKDLGLLCKILKILKITYKFKLLLELLKNRPRRPLDGHLEGR
jgi:hypothetical protein